MDDLNLLQAVRLKGRVSEAELASTLRWDRASAAARLAILVDAGMLTTVDTVRLSSQGRKRLATLLADERSGIDLCAMNAIYGEFRLVNRDFKILVTSWQIRDGQRNTREDNGYDRPILLQLDDIHDRVLPVIASAVTQLPRLALYGVKLSAALTRISAGDTIWFTRPLIDSYHTVWFELYEELIQAAGRTRENEAVAGYAH